MRSNFSLKTNSILCCKDILTTHEPPALLDLPRQRSFGTTLRLTGPVPADSRQ